MQSLSGEQRSDIINNIAELLITRKKEIMAANAKDLENAETNKIEPALFERLKLTDIKIEDLSAGTTQSMLNTQSKKIII